MSPPVLITPVEQRLALLPYHLTYYSRLGVRDFVYALWNGQDNPVFDELMRLWERWAPASVRSFSVQPTVVCSYDQYSGPAEIPGLNAIRKRLLEAHGPEAWYCIADLDEFYAFDALSLPALIALLEEGGFRAGGGVFHDRISADGGFPAIPPFEQQVRLDDLFPRAADLTRLAYAVSPRNEILPANTTKVGLARLDVAIQSGHHYVEIPAEQQAKNVLECHHFKWHAEVKALLPRRVQAYRAQGLPWAGESAWFCQFFEHPNWASAPFLNARPARKLGI